MDQSAAHDNMPIQLHILIAQICGHCLYRDTNSYWQCIQITLWVILIELGFSSVSRLSAIVGQPLLP